MWSIDEIPRVEPPWWDWYSQKNGRKEISSPHKNQGQAMWAACKHTPSPWVQSLLDPWCWIPEPSELQGLLASCVPFFLDKYCPQWITSNLTLPKRQPIVSCLYHLLGLLYIFKYFCNSLWGMLTTYCAWDPSSLISMTIEYIEN